VSERQRLPLLILVSGAPGAGKSTLARKLADRMRLQHVERDAFCESIARTMGETIDRSLEAVPLYYECLQYLLEQGVSLVTDGTLYRNKSEQEVRSHLLSFAYVINVHCHAKDEHKRFYEREVERAGGEPDWLPKRKDYLENIYQHTVDPLDLGCPVIKVDSTAEYIPALDEIIAQIEELYARSKSQKEGMR
jgi:predicted kinase